MENEEKKEGYFIIRIAAKLFNENLTADNYNKDKAMSILSRTVSPKFCQRVLEEYELDVIEALRNFKESN